MSELERDIDQALRTGATLGLAYGSALRSLAAFGRAFNEGVRRGFEGLRVPPTAEQREKNLEAARIRAYEARIERERRLGRLHVMQLAADARRELGLTPDGRKAVQ